MKCVGIDIGTYSVAIAEVESNRSELIISNFAEFPLSQIAGADHQLEIIEILRRVAEMYDPATTRFIAAIPQSNLSSRFKRFPFRERQKILKSLAFELEDEIPMDIGSAVFDGKICAYVGNAADVLAYACPEESVREVIDRLRDGGIDPEIVSAESSALSNLFEKWDQPPPTIVPPPDLNLPDGIAPPPEPATTGRLILQLGHLRSQVLVYRNDALVAVRTIFWGGSEIAESLARTFSLPYSEAIKILQTKSFILMSSQGASKDQVLLSRTVSEAVDALARELRLTLIDIGSEFNLNFKAIELLGGVAQIQNLCPYLTQQMEIPTNIYHPLEFFGNVRFERNAKVEGASALAIGLAIEGFKRPRNPAVNFRKGEYVRQNNAFNAFWQRWRPAFRAATAALILLFIYGVIRDTLATDLATAADDVLTAQGREIAGARSSGQIERYIRSQNQKIKNRETLAKLDNVNSSLDILARISEKMPKKDRNGADIALDIRQLSIVNSQLKIEGKVQNAAHVVIVRDALAQVASGVTKNPRTTKPIDQPGIPFAFTATVKRQ